ncbi:MAG: pyridoxal-phosphate dependent enzyme [Bacteroidota bacterium]|nr:pyridoxal-phosphate dependent enzyme [Bacteroidota bacterium]
MSKLYNNILETIGNTPLVRINRITKDLPCDVYAKLESFNPGNSVKDRIGIKMIEDAEAAGILKPGATIIEGTSGNTGMGLALAAIIKGYKCIFTTTDKQSKEKIDILKAVGAEVIVCPTNVDPEDERSYYSVSSRLVRETPNSWKPNQYDNLSNRQAHYQTTGPEIWEQTDGKITHFIAGVGTGGTISGIGKYLKEQNPDIKIWGIDTYGSVFKKYKETGEFDTAEIYPYITEGIGEDILPENVDFSIIDAFEKVTDKDGFVMTRRLAKEEGILAGNSSGSAVAGALQLKSKFKAGDLVVILLPDHATRYIGKAFNDEWMKERGFLETKQLTASDLLNSSATLITVDLTDRITIAVQTMREADVDQLVVTDQGEIVGSLTESKLYQVLLSNPEMKDNSVADIMDKPFPMVSESTSYSEISTMINRENNAVLVKKEDGQVMIITKYDIIQAIAG